MNRAGRIIPHRLASKRQFQTAASDWAGNLVNVGQQALTAVERWSMARVISFYIPDRFKPKPRPSWPREESRVLEFPRPKSYTHPTWIFPEVDGDLSAREG